MLALANEEVRRRQTDSRTCCSNYKKLRNFLRRFQNWSMREHVTKTLVKQLHLKMSEILKIIIMKLKLRAELRALPFTTNAIAAMLGPCFTRRGRQPTAVELLCRRRHRCRHTSLQGWRTRCASCQSTDCKWIICAVSSQSCSDG